MKVPHSAVAVAILLVLAGAVLAVLRLAAPQAPTPIPASASVTPVPDLTAPSSTVPSAAPTAPAAPTVVDTPAATTAPQAAPPPAPAAPGATPQNPTGHRPRADTDRDARRGDGWDDDEQLSPAERQARDEARRHAADAVCDKLGIPRWRCESQAEANGY